MSKLIKGRDAQSWGKLLEIPEKKDWLGLGYKPANESFQKTNQKKLCTLQETFHGAGYRGEMVVVEEEEEGIPNLVCHSSPNTTLNNWKTINISEMIFQFEVIYCFFNNNKSFAMPKANRPALQGPIRFNYLFMNKIVFLFSIKILSFHFNFFFQKWKYPSIFFCSYQIIQNIIINKNLSHAD